MVNKVLRKNPRDQILLGRLRIKLGKVSLRRIFRVSRERNRGILDWKEVATTNREEWKRTKLVVW